MRALIIRLFLCIFIFVFFLYLYVDRHNRLMELRLRIPSLKKEIEVVEEKNTHLAYEIDKFENPANLLKIAEKPEYGHLKYFLEKDIIVIEENND
jgi:cell division protein FtsB